MRFGCTLWDFSINNAKHLKVFDSTQRGATSPILRIMKSDHTDALVPELSILSTVQHIEELKEHESIKLLIKLLIISSPK